MLLTHYITSTEDLVLLMNDHTSIDNPEGTSFRSMTPWVTEEETKSTFSSL